MFTFSNRINVIARVEQPSVCVADDAFLIKADVKPHYLNYRSSVIVERIVNAVHFIRQLLLLLLLYT